MNPATTRFLRPFGALILLAAALVLVFPLQNAHAKNVILTGVLEAQIICHDGANRGAYMTMVVHHNGYQVGITSYKGYYTKPACFDLGNYNTKVGEVYEVVYNATDMNAFRPCRNFGIRYKKNGKKIWVQTGGTTVWNISCVAKDGI